MTRSRRLCALAVAVLVLVSGALGAAAVQCLPAPIPALRAPRATPRDELIAATFPPRWTVGRSWVLEVEQDFAGLDVLWHPGRYFARHDVVVVAGNRAVLRWDFVTREQRPDPWYFVVSLDPFQVQHERVIHVPDDWAHALSSERPLSSQPIDAPNTHGCAGAPRPWPLPFSQSHQLLGRELVGARLWPRRFADRSQCAEIVGDAAILFEIEESAFLPPRSAHILWRLGSRGGLASSARAMRGTGRAPTVPRAPGRSGLGSSPSTIVPSRCCRGSLRRRTGSEAVPRPTGSRRRRASSRSSSSTGRSGRGGSEHGSWPPMARRPRPER